MRKLVKENQFSFRSRVRGAIVVPVMLLALAVVSLAAWGLHSAARQSDEISIQRQTREAELAISAAEDDLARSQTGVAIWDMAVAELRKPQPDWTWIDANVGSWLNAAFDHQSDFILDGHDRPVYATSGGKRVPAHRYLNVAAAIAPLVEAVRGRTHIAPSPHERLPGFKANPESSARTSLRTVHATDLVKIIGRPAAVSVMRMIPDTSALAPTPGREPLLVSIRYLDAGFSRDLSDIKMIDGARITRDPSTARGETSLPLVSSRGEPLGYFVWQPDLPGSALLRKMGPIAAAVVAILVGALVLLAMRLAKIMRKDAYSLHLLNEAHIELKEQEAQAKYLAYHDSLTGLPNRALFNRTVDQALEHWDPECPCAMMLLDLDRFKQVNDTLGHLGGDMLLEQIASRLLATAKDATMVARLGGDEFAILFCAGTEADRVEELRGEIVQALGAPFSILGSTVSIGVSVGVAIHSDPMTRRSQVMREADLAMYSVKRDQREPHSLDHPDATALRPSGALPPDTPSASQP